MKKVSTVAAKPSRNISQQQLTIGLDLGDRNSWYCVLDEAGRIQLEQRVRTTAKVLQEVFGAMPRSRIALEIGTHSPWISRLLSELGHEVIVANAHPHSVFRHCATADTNNGCRKLMIGRRSLGAVFVVASRAGRQENAGKRQKREKAFSWREHSSSTSKAYHSAHAPPWTTLCFS